MVRKTNINLNTDNDSTKDYNDPVPLDYDMDGDGYINRDSLINPASTIYVERIAIAVSNDQFLARYSNGDPIPEYDTDNGGDNDMDGDDREDIYSSSGEDSVYDNDWDNDGMDTVYETDYGVIHNGWQHPYIYNARYAVLIGGGDTDSSNNYDAFKNDLKAMYDKLKGYNYLDENIYCYLWDKSKGYLDGRVDGPAIQNDTLNNVDELTIEEGFIEIGQKITKNDFFFFTEICHGNKTSFQILKRDSNGVRHNDFISFAHYDKDGNIVAPSTNRTLENYFNDYFGGKNTEKKYARMIAIFESCKSGGAVSDNLTGDSRILISAAKDDELAYCEAEIGDALDDHTAFLYRGHALYSIGDVRWDGFILSMGSISNPQSVKHAYDKGYEAATKNGNYLCSPAYIDYWDSHPLLDDNFDGVGHTKGSMGDDGNLAKYTYL